MTSALVMIDVQRGMFAFRRPLYQADAFLGRVADLLARARAARVPILHVRHDGGPGHLLARDSEGWIHHAVAMPLAGETIIDKRHSSAFHDTPLQRTLEALGVDHLVVAGIQTEMCVDSACRAAAALGYRVTLTEDGHTTFDSPVLTAAQIIAHHNQTLSSGFADLSTAADIRF